MADVQRRIHAIEMRCFCKILHISYKDHITNEKVCSKIKAAIDPFKSLIMVKKHNLKWLWSCLLLNCPCQNHPARHCARKNKGQTMEEVGGQNQWVDRTALLQVPEGRHGLSYLAGNYHIISGAQMPHGSRDR